MADQDIFKALSDPTRRNILKMLAKGDMTAGDIAEGFNISKPSISHHFSILKAADLVRTTRDGQNIVYQINSSVLEDATRLIFDIMNVDDKSAQKSGETSDETR
ncbi:MAG: autorepressor SdpR family transcription factor [Pseudomonadota bacterium]